jgi:hypothetical protein
MTSRLSSNAQAEVCLREFTGWRQTGHRLPPAVRRLTGMA